MIATGVTLTQTGIGFIPILGGHIYNGGLDRITHPLRNDHQAHILKGHTGKDQAAEDNGVDKGDFFTAVYKVLIGKERGPKLAGFLKACSTLRLVSILSRY